jgi:hypothetical protein
MTEVWPMRRQLDARQSKFGGMAVQRPKNKIARLKTDKPRQPK